MQPIRAAILILSDKGFTGEREDKSGPALKALLEGRAEVVSVEILPDDRERISSELCRLCDGGGVDVVLTSGGTGLAPRDVTPQATLDAADYPVPGIAEAIRARSMLYTDRAMLSRGVACVRGRTLIVNLPGSPKAVAECAEVILPVLGHAVETLRGDAYECARK